jgi:hypothetical protein
MISLKELFEITPHHVESSYEFENFRGNTGVGKARFYISLVNRVRKITSDLANSKLPVYEKTCLKEEHDLLVEYLEQQNIQEMLRVVKNWQAYEENYWIDLLGKIAAVELLVNDKLSEDTMTKLIRLPEESYIKTIQNSLKLANLVKNATVKAETEIGIVPTETANNLNKQRIILKPVK